MAQSLQNLIVGCVLIALNLVACEFTILFAGDVMKQWGRPVFLTYLQLSSCIVFAPFAYFQTKRFTTTDIWHASVTAVLYFSGTVTYTWSLGGMLGSVNSCICQITIVVTYLLSIFLLGDSCTKLKNVSVVFTIAGAVLTAVLGGPDNTNSDQKTEVLSIILLLISTCIWPFYFVLFSKFIGENSDIIDTLAYVGLQGICAVIFFWPIVLICHFTVASEHIEAPPKKLLMQFVLLVCLKPFLASTGLLATGLTSPLFTNVAFTLIIPISMIGDMVKFSFKPPVWFYVGMITVLIGCALNVLAEYWQNKDQKESIEEDEESIPVIDMSKSTSVMQ